MMSASVYGRCLVDGPDGNMVSKLCCRTGQQVSGTINRMVNLKWSCSLDVSFGKKKKKEAAFPILLLTSASGRLLTGSW